MRLRAGLILGLGALVLAALWASGGLAALAWWTQGQQRALQSALGAAVAGLRAGAPGAVGTLVALCAAYGFLHALGPGHGKALVAGAALGTRASVRRMALIALAGSIGQAVVAISLVYGGFSLLGVTARSLAEGAERWAAPVGNAAVALIGCWLLWRGLRALAASAAGAGHVHGPGCAHRHGPTAAEARDATGPGATLALIGAMAARPCTGAIFVLVIAWRMDLPGAGAAGVLAMGLGTAAFTAMVAWLAVSSRDAAFLTAGPGGAARLVGPGLQVIAGGAILAVAGLSLLGGALT